MPIDVPGSWLDRIVAFCLNAGKAAILGATALMIAGIAFADWQIGFDVSLGLLYILPMVLAAVVLPQRGIIALAFLCDVMRSFFQHSGSGLESSLRFVFAFLSYTSAALFLMAVIRNRQMTLEHLRLISQEQRLRNQAEEQLKTLVESSPAGILTLDCRGRILAANKSVSTLFGIPEDQILTGKHIDRYLPILSDALQLDTGVAPFRTAAQSQGMRENRELFLADIWFSTYGTAAGKHLAAIVIDSSEDMREREEQNLRQLATNSRIMAGAMLHEVRNLCAAIASVYSGTPDNGVRYGDENIPGLEQLTRGLASIASLELHCREAETLEAVSLKDVLDDLRIIIEPAWLEIGGLVRWEVPDNLPRVLADRHGLLQIFLNLSQNSRRAVSEAPVRELRVSALSGHQRVNVQIRDSGHGIAAVDRLFKPFQLGAESTGLGLYISRSLARSYGGELRFEPQESGACFVVELLNSAPRATNHV